MISNNLDNIIFYLDIVIIFVNLFLVGLLSGLNIENKVNIMDKFNTTLNDIIIYLILLSFIPFVNLFLFGYIVGLILLFNKKIRLELLKD